MDVNRVEKVSITYKQKEIPPVGIFFCKPQYLALHSGLQRMFICHLRAIFCFKILYSYHFQAKQICIIPYVKVLYLCQLM